MKLQFSFEELAGACPDASLLVTSAGEIVAFNDAVQTLLTDLPAPLLGTKLHTCVEEDPRSLRASLETWSRSRQPTPATLTWRLGDGTSVVCRCDGALVRPATPTGPALLLLRLQRKASATAQFVLLNQKIDELNHEVRARLLAEQELRELNARLEEEVQHRTRELRQANDELRHRNRELQEFASVASHDLQEPLRKVRAFADLLHRHLGEDVDEEARRYLERIETSAARMTSLIKALLELSRVSTQRNAFEPVDLNRVAEEVVADLETRIAETKGRIEMGRLPTLTADPTQMRQLFQNLIGNALKYHRPAVPPRVEVQASVEQEPYPDGDAARRVCVLTFRDNGIGFDQKYAARLFSPFQRLHANEGYEGAGMGLAICRRIAERHNGRILAQSAPNAGSRFVVYLPLA